MYNLINCAGFGDQTDWVAVGDCMPGRIGLVLLFFVVAICKKWVLGDDESFSINMIYGLILTLVPYLITVTMFGSFKWAMLIGLGGMLVWLGLTFTGIIGEAQ